jgi:hypothetical protein
MDRLNRRRAKQIESAEVRIKFAMLSFQCKAAMEWETRKHLYTRSIFIYISKKILQEKAVEATKQKEEKRKKS